jgi:hypothetical protein
MVVWTKRLPFAHGVGVIDVSEKRESFALHQFDENCKSGTKDTNDAYKDFWLVCTHIDHNLRVVTYQKKQKETAVQSQSQ